jgi:hypothetical protein
MPEEGSDQTSGGDNFVGVDFFALPVGGLWFGRFEFDRRAFHEEGGLRPRRHVEEAQDIFPVVVSGNADEFVQDG